MSTLSRRRTFPPAGMTPWMLNLAARMLARILNMPEPLVHHTGAFVFAHVQTIESGVGRTLCPIRLLRQFRNRLGPSAPLIVPVLTTEKENRHDQSIRVSAPRHPG